LGLTPANVSYHMRQLAKYGFIEEGSSVPGRARPWRVRSAGHAWDGVGADADWRRAAFLSESLLYLTREELAEVGRMITDLLLTFGERIDPALRPGGSMPVQVLAAGFPLPPSETGN